MSGVPKTEIAGNLSRPLQHQVVVERLTLSRLLIKSTERASGLAQNVKNDKRIKFIFGTTMATYSTYLSLFLFICFCQAQDGLIVQTNLGAVKGITMTSTEGHKFYAYRGIPYAQPPLGNLRFRVSRKNNLPLQSITGLNDIRGSYNDYTRRNIFLRFMTITFQIRLHFLPIRGTAHLMVRKILQYVLNLRPISLTLVQRTASH